MEESGYKQLICSRAELPPRYYGNIAYYLAVAAHAGNARMRGDLLYDKRYKQAHRFEVAGSTGPTQLTMPIIKPHGIQNAGWVDVAISTHGNWWHVHLETLKTLYGRSPFFEFYIDRFLPFMNADTPRNFSSVLEIDCAIDKEIRTILLLPTPDESDGSLVSAYTNESESSAGSNTNVDNNTIINNSDLNFTSAILPYWQVPSDHHGFIPNLSILDLIFNLGPEAPLYLTRCLHFIGEAKVRDSLSHAGCVSQNEAQSDLNRLNL